MFEIQRIHAAAVPAALDKAHRYRLLNEPLQAESICLDVLEIEPDNQQALVTLLLALSDQFSSGTPAELNRARQLIPLLKNEYERLYYAGIIAERRAIALVELGGSGRGHVAYNLLREAMDWYAQAQKMAPENNDDAVLRSNTCIRLIQNNDHIRPAPDHPIETMIE